ncbi:hypothetical protein FEM08_07330 [Flavobacterium gilvum]|nr:hypothetical protein FEM08_07330 [Flavobacterium gilvum]
MKPPTSGGFFILIKYAKFSNNYNCNYHYSYHMTSQDSICQ